MNCLLAVRSEIKIKFGLGGFAAAHVQKPGQVADIESEGFAHLRQKFPKMSKTKMKERIFVGSQIKQLFEDHDFSTKSNSTEIIIKQYSNLFITNAVFERNAFSLTFGGGGGGSLVVMFRFSNVKTITITLNFNRERFGLPTSVIYDLIRYVHLLVHRTIPYVFF
jgi:hypothetical protein